MPLAPPLPPLKIALVGTFTVDEIRPVRGPVQRGYGGLYHAVVAFAQLSGARTELFPIARVGADIYGALVADLRALGPVNTAGLRETPGPNNRVFSYYTTATRRMERSVDIPPALTLPDLGLERGYDALYVNCISGRELRPATVRGLARDAAGLQYLDFHSLALGLRRDGRRFYRRPRHWEAWCAPFACVQMNADEARVLAGVRTLTAAHREALARRVLGLGPAIVIITHGHEGSHLYTRRGPAVDEMHFPPPRVTAAHDVPGCGDAYAAGFVMEYLRSGDVRRAGRLATRIAGTKALGRTAVPARGR